MKMNIDSSELDKLMGLEDYEEWLEFLIEIGEISILEDVALLVQTA